MICKDHDEPIKLWKLESLVGRVQNDLQVFPEIEESLRIVSIGDRGERSLDYYIVLIESPDLLCFHDLRLPRGDYFFQIDTTLVTPRFILLVEVKSLSGDIYFDLETKQMIRVLNGISEKFPNPVLQVLQQKHQLEQFLIAHHFPDIPIYTLVVSASRKGILHIKPNDTFHLGNVINIQEFIFKYQKINESNAQPVWNDSHLQAVQDLFLREHTPVQVDLMNQFGLTLNDLKKGVRCPVCKRLGVKRKHGSWLCQCSATSKDAHISGLRDYALLVDEWITNKEARDFLGIENREVSKYLLAQLNVPKFGKGKGMKYQIGKLINSPYI